MIEQPLAKSKPFGSIALFLLFGGIFFGLCSAWILRGALLNGYPQIMPLIVGGFFGVFALSCFGSMYFQGGFFEVFDDRLVVYSYLRTKIKTIIIRDIIKWNEDIYGDDKKTKSLTVCTANKKYTIATDDEEYNYDLIKEILTKENLNGTSVVHDKEDDVNSQKKSTDKVMFVFYIVVFAFCSWLIYSGLRQYFQPNDDLKYLSLTEIGGVIVSTPEAHTGSGRGDYNYVRFDLKDLPKIHFYMENPWGHDLNRTHYYCLFFLILLCQSRILRIKTKSPTSDINGPYLLSAIFAAL